MQAVSRQPRVSARLADPELRLLIERVARRRLPEMEVDDLVQTVLCDALAAEHIPEDDEQLRKWLVGITRHKVADFHRRGSRAKHVELTEQHGVSEAHSAREWAQWADSQTAGDADAKRTLDWMARESGGEKLAHIAEEEQLPPAQVRQRVSRMRRWMQERWKAELAAVAIVAALALVAWMLLKGDSPVADPVEPDPVPAPFVPPVVDPRLERAERVRADALSACEREAWSECVKGLDDAAELDPAGDTEDAVQRARRRAREALAPRKDDVEEKLEKKAPPTPSTSAPQTPSPTTAPVKPVKGKGKGDKSSGESSLDEPIQAPAPLPSDPQIDRKLEELQKLEKKKQQLQDTK